MKSKLPQLGSSSGGSSQIHKSCTSSFRRKNHLQVEWERGEELLPKRNDSMQRACWESGQRKGSELARYWVFRGMLLKTKSDSTLETKSTTQKKSPPRGM